MKSATPVWNRRLYAQLLLYAQQFFIITKQLLVITQYITHRVLYYLYMIYFHASV